MICRVVQEMKNVFRKHFDKNHDLFSFFRETDNRPVRFLISANINVINKRINFV